MRVAALRYSRGKTSAQDCAVIVGRITHDRAAAHGSVPVDLLTVEVAGADIRAGIDHLGRFTLRGVPPGIVQLEFAGVDRLDTVAIPEVEAQDEIYVDLRISPRAPAA